jgi:hypothetical protein
VNLDEVIGLSVWGQAEVTDKKIIDSFKAVIDILNTNAQNGQQQTFQTERTKLLNDLSGINLRGLSLDQLAFLDLLSIRQHVGRRGANGIDEVFVKFGLDIKAAAKRLEEIAALFKASIVRFNNIRDSFKDLNLKSVDMSDKVVVRITYKDGVTIKTVVDYEERAAELRRILRGIVMPFDYSDTECYLISMSNGSFKLDFIVPTLKIAGLITALSLQGLTIAEKYHKEQIVIEQLHALKREDVIAAALALEKGTSDAEDKEIKDLADKSAADIQLMEKHQEDVRTAYRSAVHDLICFVRDGGTTECISGYLKSLPNHTAEDKALATEVETNNVKIRQITAQREERLRLLENKAKATEDQL